jgi:hypothetical protein
MGTVSFDGQAPFVTPNPLLTRTFSAGDVVEVHIRLPIPNRDLGDLVFRLTANQARVLAKQLNQSASEIVP